MADAEYFAQKDNSTIVAIYDIAEWYKAKGIENLVHMNIGGKVHLPFGTVKMVAAVHSSVLPDGTYGGNPAGFVVESAEKIDFAFLPIGGQLTMDIYDAITAANWVNTKKIIGMHFDTFPIIEIDPVECLEAARQTGKELILMQIGEKINL